MERNTGVNIGAKDIKTELQDVYWQFIKKRAEEYGKRQLTGRLVIDFQKGKVNSIFDQAVVAGASSVLFYLDKIDGLL
jgi:hypothetical protein